MNNQQASHVLADLELSPTPSPLSAEERAKRLDGLGFGKLFSEHMIVIPYGGGTWGRGSVKPYAPIQLEPAASVFHYGQAVFEGFKAYRQPDGGIKTFQPYKNAHRLNQSARRLAMPEIPAERFVAAVDALIELDREWVPAGRGKSLYLRPFMIATDPALGVRPSDSYLFFVLGSPAGSYFAGGIKPVTVWVADEYIRAAPGGTGFAKCAGNYAASLIVQREAQLQGCDQVVWLDAVERRYIEEMGGMNMMFVYQKGDRFEIVTPPVTGTILEGVTRGSIITLAQELGYDVVERRITVDEWQEAVAGGQMVEAFACGTAATVTPIGHVRTRNGSWTINDGQTGPVTECIRNTLLDIQYGVTADKHDWMHTVLPGDQP